VAVVISISRRISSASLPASWALIALYDLRLCESRFSYNIHLKLTFLILTFKWPTNGQVYNKMSTAPSNRIGIKGLDISARFQFN
jgi:hypothetical protein